MKRNILIRLSVVIGILALTRSVSGVSSTDEQVKDLAQRYAQVESQLSRSVHYVKKENSDGGTTIEQAWFNGAGDLIKVAVERTNSSGRELTEYFSPDFEQYGPIFVLRRKETAQPDGATQVDESRRYFGSDGELIRELRKSGRFKPGEPLDTAHIPNVIVDLSEKAKGNQNEQEKFDFDDPQKIAESLQQSSPPETNPFASVTGDSEKFRVIHRTASPDGRYAIALGFTKGKIDWETLKDPNSPGTYWKEESAHVDPKYGKTVNYVVNLTTRRILGTTGCGYFGTRDSYNHRECEVFWSPDSKNFVELDSAKWNYLSCRAGRIMAGPKLLGTVDLGRYAEKTASGFLAKHKHPKYYGRVAIGLAGVNDDGMIDLTVGAGFLSEGQGEQDFDLTERIRLRETPAGLRLETVSVRKSPQE
jgi:hypothetical protein